MAETAAAMVLALLAVIILGNLANGTLGAWLKAKFLHKAPAREDGGDMSATGAAAGLLLLIAGIWLLLQTLVGNLPTRVLSLNAGASSAAPSSTTNTPGATFQGQGGGEAGAPVSPPGRVPPNTTLPGGGLGVIPGSAPAASSSAAAGTPTLKDPFAPPGPTNPWIYP